MKHPVDTSQWGEFVAKDLFGPSQLGKYHNPKNLQESETGYPYICASNLNNGINTSMPYVTGDDLKPTPANIISWGKQCPYFTYHDKPCITSQGMYYINVADYSKLQIDFIITILTALTREYNYTNCLIGKLFDELVLKLPLKPSTDPSNYDQTDIDWDYMETVMSRVTTRAKERLTSLPQPTDKKKTPVDTSAWGEFVVGELFDVHPTKAYKLKNSELLTTSGKNPVVVNSSYNNGIGGYTDQELTESGGILTFSDTTSGADTLFFQEKPFVGYPHVQGMYPKTFQLTTNVAKFMIASLRASINKYSWNYTNKLTRTFITSTTVKLPLKPSANPSDYTQDDIDWDYMENFMKIIEEKAQTRLKTLQKTIA